MISEGQVRAASAEKWTEYRRILRVLYSVCWDCRRPCPACQAWARHKAFGKPTAGLYLDAACADTYAAATEMERRGTSILIDMRGASPERRVRTTEAR
jgi:hypothetical protein